MSKLEDIATKLHAGNIPDIDFIQYLKTHESDKELVKRVADFYDDIEHYIENGDKVSGAKMPFRKLDNKFGFRDGEVTLWSGYNGHKKSMILGFVAVNLLKQRQRVCMASFEMKPISTIKRMTTQYTQHPAPSYDQYADFMSFAGSDFYILDKMGGMTPQRLYGVIMYCANELKVKHFMIDSLMRIVPKEDDYNAQKDFIVKLCDLAIKLNIHIHIVHHTGKGDETKISNRYNAKGSGAISDNVHNSWIVWANKENNKDMPDVVLKCDKQREGAWEGKIALSFEAETISFSEMYGIE